MQRTMLFLTMLSICASAALAVPTKVNITKLDQAVTIDGDPAEEAWTHARRIEQFVEYYKGDNTAPPAKTVGLLAYDAEAVYVAFVAEDPHPSAIRAPLVDRDKVLGDQDYVAILIDTLNDRRSGVAFRVNPRGVQTDSVVNDANGEEDFSPDFFYEAVARRTDKGWSAEMRIPLASLRYPPSDPQTWGVIMMRNYPRDFRYIMSNTPIPKNSGCFLCHASEVDGLEGLPTGSHFTIAPYTSAAQNTRLGSSNFENDFGLDMKWNPSAGLTIDGTLNPDFSQIEADVPQLEVNNRFALSYPEKRTFFLEGVDLLATPILATYTRSITSPAWGMRATGHAGSNAYTFLVAEDRGGGTTILPGAQRSEFVPQDFRSRVALGRIRRSFGDSFGAFMVSTRENEGGGHNRLLGPDFLWKRSERDKVFGQFLYSSTENPDRPDLSEQFRGQSFDGHAYRVVFQRDAKRYDIWAATSGYSPGFRADNGFVVQTGLRRFGFWPGLRFYPQNHFFSYLRPYSGLEHDAGFTNNETLRTGLWQGIEFEGKWGSNGWMAMGHIKERVGSVLLTRNQLELNLRAAPRGWLPAIQLDGTIGDKIDYAGARLGDGAQLNLSGTLRATDHLEVQLRTSREWLDLDTGRLFNAQIDWLKATYTFSPRSLVRAIAQHKTVERNGSIDERTTLSGLYAWKLNWQTVFFLGYGDEQDSRSIFMKVAYAFQH